MICGAGGGFDLFTGLPLYFYLKPRVEQVFLGNLSFASLSETDGVRMTAGLLKIDSKTTGSEEYFPEQLLCRWFREQGEDLALADVDGRFAHGADETCLVEVGRVRFRVFFQKGFGAVTEELPHIAGGEFDSFVAHCALSDNAVVSVRRL